MTEFRLARVLGGAALLLMVSGGCRGCFCTSSTKASGEEAPPDVVKEEAKKELEKSPAKLSTICGVNVSALKDMIVTIMKSDGERHQVRVEGTAIQSTTMLDASADNDDEDDDGDADINEDAAPTPTPSVPTVAAPTKKDAGPIIADPAKSILCIGVVALTIHHVLDKHGNHTGWKSSELEIESVLTAGVLFEKAKHTSKPHHRRHHHHH